MALTTLQTNQHNDLFLPDGRNLSIIEGLPACSQSVLQATMMRTSEDVYDTAKGIDYFGLVFSPQPDYDGIRLAITNAILSVKDVVSIESLVIDVSANSFNYSALINTIYGQTQVKV